MKKQVCAFFTVLALILAMTAVLVSCGETNTPTETTAAEESQVQICQACGATIPNDAKFCSVCGANLAADTNLEPEVTQTPETSLEAEKSQPPETTIIPDTTSAPETTEPPHVHAWSDWILVFKVTCTNDGRQDRSCYCGEKESQAIPTSGHAEAIDQAVAPTCTEAGLTEGKHCSVCNQVLIKQETVKAKGHTEVIDKAVASTCTTTGLTEGKHCSACNKVLKKQETVKAKGHTEVIDKAVAATCTKTGLTEGKHCSICNVVLKKQEMVKAKGHTEVIDKAVTATCTKTGLTEGKHCSICNEILIAQQQVTTTTNHEYGKWIMTTETSCESDGEGYRTCACGARETKVFPATGHNWSDATCSVPSKCSNCKLTRGDALGHKISGAKCSVCKMTGRDILIAYIREHDQSYSSQSSYCRLGYTYSDGASIERELQLTSKGLLYVTVMLSDSGITYFELGLDKDSYGEVYWYMEEDNPSGGYYKAYGYETPEHIRSNTQKLYASYDNYPSYLEDLALSYAAEVLKYACLFMDVDFSQFGLSAATFGFVNYDW